MRRHFALLLLPSLLGTAAVSHAEIIERIIAKVNGEIITLTEFQERQIAAAQAARVGPAQVAVFLRSNNARILQEAIDEILLLQRAQDAGLGLRPEFVDEVIESIKKENKLESEEQFQAALAQEGLTLDELRKSIEKQWTRRMIVQRDVEPKIAVSEQELKAAYEERKDAEFTNAATVSLQEIFVSDESGGAALARELVERARAGADFAELARQHSAAPSAEAGGDLGQIAQGDVNPTLEEVAFGLSVGSVSDPIPVEGGHRILKVVAKTSGSVVSYESAKAKLRDHLMMDRFETAYEAYMQDIRGDAQVTLMVREVPLQLTGPVPEDTLLEGLDPFSLGPAPIAPAPVGPAGAAPPAPAPSGGDEFITTPQSRPERVSPPGAGTDDEILTTPQERPERVAPPAPTETDESETRPPSR